MSYLPSKERIVQEAIVATIGVIAAAFFISRFKSLQAFVEKNSVWNLGMAMEGMTDDGHSPDPDQGMN